MGMAGHPDSRRISTHAMLNHRKIPHSGYKPDCLEQVAGIFRAGIRLVLPFLVWALCSTPAWAQCT
ncbi:MAG: hypothetical protein KIT18_09645, partial [Burkholderiales bacterium]|nr:hypothetical protein [Burkholderiales bacterium]